MSKNLEKDFSLKDWVNNRAANVPGLDRAADRPQEKVVRENIMPDMVRDMGIASFMGEETMSKSSKILRQDMPASEHAAESAVEETISPTVADDTRIQNKVTARVSNGLSSPSAIPAPAQQVQIVRLLRDLGDRLRQSEKEREILWREVESCRKLLGDVEDKANKAEKAYLSIENKISMREPNESAEEKELHKEELNAFQKKIEDKINSLETTAGSAVLRIEDAISENTKLSRRLEQVSADKSRLLRKMETMEETLTQTQDALKSKALVLLTDQALASRVNAPQMPAWSGNDTVRVQNAPNATEQLAKNALSEDAPWWKKQTKSKSGAAMLVSVLLVGATIGWGSAHISIGTNTTTETMPSENTLNPAEKTQDTLMDDAAKIASQIAPDDVKGEQAVAASPLSNTSDIEQQIYTIEQKALAEFLAEKPLEPVQSRIQPDKKLPASVKEIEAKALGGDAEAQHDLAAIYTAGHAGVKTNYDKAALWFSESAYNGIANAQYNLAVLYHQGLGVKQDTKIAMNLYRAAASNNHPEAQYNLGIAYIEGVGTSYNPQFAAYYFDKAALGGVVEAAYNMGLIQENGLLGETLPDEAVFWYKLAADKGNEQAKTALKQLAKQISMNDADIERTFARVSAEKPEYLKTPAAITKPPEKKAEVLPPPAPKAVEKKAEAKKSANDAVIVAQVQEQLMRIGLYGGPADGAVNAQTADAVKSYQSKNNMKVDGIPSQDVLVNMLASEMQVRP